MSRTQYDPSRSAEPTPKSSTSRQSLPAEFGGRTGQQQASTEPSTSTPQSPRQDSSSEGYPSWLPKRPPPPAPPTVHSTRTSGLGMYSDAGPSGEPFYVGRKPTPRSVRIVSLQDSSASEKDKHPRRESTDPSRLFSPGAHPRVWSRATSAGLSTTLFSQAHGVPRPRFRSSSLHLELLRSPSWKMRLWFYLYPVFVFLHIPLQTFFDFNAVYILLLAAKYPNALAPGVAGSGRNWALGAAAYIACWAVQVFVVFLMYEIIYSFVRRWRVKRPLVLPIYLSSPAFSLAAMSSYTNFCFLQHIRASAFNGEHGSFRDGLAESFYFHSQNLPTVALLLPRAGLSIALLLAFWTPQPGELGLTDAGIRPRDGTFFRAADQTLTDYARGVLIANAAWTAWRVLVLLASWIGLWTLSGQGCAGLCGPRYRWEEEDAEKTVAGLGDTFTDGDALPWTWRECTLLRIVDAYEFCLTNKLPRGTWEKGSKGRTHSESKREGFDGIDKVFAAIGIGQTDRPAKRPVLSEGLFDSPEPNPNEQPEETPRHSPTSIEAPPPAAQTREKEAPGPSAPLKDLPYPFTGRGAQVSNEDVIPFPPSPEPEEGDESERETHEGEGEEEGEEEGLEFEEEQEEGRSAEADDSELTSDGGRRTSGSMSSLGRPVTSRYPFSFRRPRARGGSVSTVSHRSQQSQALSSPTSPHTMSTPSRSTQSRSTHSHSTKSTGNRESSDSPSSNASSPPSARIPMPPRHPQTRSRARTIPAPSASGSQSSPSPVSFPGSRSRGHTRTGSDLSMTFGPQQPVPFVLDSEDEEGREGSLMDVPEVEGSIEEAEQRDSVGLLYGRTSAPASRTSLRQFTSGLHRRSNGSRSRSGTTSRSASRSRTTSSNSHSDSARSRAQSLIQSLGAASRSSLDLVTRSRAHSMQRLSDSPYYSPSPDPMPSSPENNTFGFVRRPDTRHAHDDNRSVSDVPELPSPVSASRSHSTSNVSVMGDEPPAAPPRPRQRQASEVSHAAPSELSVQTERAGQPRPTPSAPVQIPGRPAQPQESVPDLSTANASLVTGPATVQGTTDSSRTPSSWGTRMNQHLGQGGAWEPA
ncbi:hypothetical protein PsYK624_159360 [Phanerochaete sordida]|uniref:Proteophosphoglycan ppg4 n=1 Tax=Phanerochaete sordida TaxID=48140 RepID=A0A9P3GQ42_9APHY|nr:hypothetical protein PsYK624_159360 [Phanerochaete sordida]